jgi:hypothetical protein
MVFVLFKVSPCGGQDETRTTMLECPPKPPINYNFLFPLSKASVFVMYLYITSRLHMFNNANIVAAYVTFHIVLYQQIGAL